MPTVDAWLGSVDAPTRAMIAPLRALALGAASGVAEQIKWNAPSFSLGGEDRITMGIEAKGGVRAILHRGVKAKEAAGFAFDDPAGLARWPAVDRGVLIFKTEAEITDRAAELADLFTRWFAATR